LKKSPNVENLDYTGTKHMTGTGNDLDNTMTAGAGSATFNGGAGNDTLIGGQGVDNLLGGMGNDRLWAGSGSGNFKFDQLSGGSGDDTLIAGGGSTKMHGGSGSDIFVFESQESADILDFNSGEDRIALELDIFSQLTFTDGRLDAGQFKQANGYTTAQTAQEHLIYDATSGYLYYDPDGSGSESMYSICQIGKGLTLTAADFMSW
jgi:Ca2+-binding RTX toxin-like protein